MSHAKRMTPNNKQNPECHACRCRDKETAGRQKLSRRKIHGRSYFLNFQKFTHRHRRRHYLRRRLYHHRHQ